MKNSRKGFTLVEILVVVAITGLIATMAIPAFQKVRESSQDKIITHNLRQIQMHAEIYFLNHREVEVVNVDDLIEPEAGRWSFKKIEPLRGEVYPEVVRRGELFVSLVSDPEATHRKGKDSLNSSGNRD